jgi:transcriptional regulator with PAS, ATPase and Fis domain
MERVAATDSSVFITGATGTGKELAARAIHDKSPRRDGAFVDINCSAIPETLIEAELFGHQRGTFTGAHENRSGLFEKASGGTLFLDEVGAMSPALQAKLLRVLQEREFERVGESNTVKIDVRVIGATHSDLAKMVSEGTFREDLFYRLNVIPVHMPALRERREDIPLLVQHFLDRLAADSGKPPVTMSQEAIRQLMAYPWPGNVRQLENTIERAMAFSRGRTQLDVSDLAPEIQTRAAAAGATEVAFPDEGIDFERYVEAVELSLIRRSLERTQGNKRQAAQLLNLKRTTLIEKLKRLNPRETSKA